jgi:hypothetical protein
MTDDEQTSKYVRGETYARKTHARVETKPSATDYTGGGYRRIRSTERREHTPGDGTDDVFVSVHRLAAVAWHLPDGTLGTDVFLEGLDGVDVHHTQPDADVDTPGMPSANGPAWTALVDHGRHSEITQTEMRAYGADAKRALAGDGGSAGVGVGVEGGCPECGGAVDGDGATVGDAEGLCLDCATERAKQRGLKVKL